jgi:hypothetical protein
MCVGGLEYQHIPKAKHIIWEEEEEGEGGGGSKSLKLLLYNPRGIY